MPSSNLYKDTRGLAERPVPFTHAVAMGLAEGGGLFVPERIPQLSLDDIMALAELPYAARAARIYQAFDIDIEGCEIDALMAQAYGSNFDTEKICPVVALEPDTYLLELWHGPTSAFKDMALQCLPLFFSASIACLREQGAIDHDFAILVATSGDTGKAALEGFANKPGVRIGVLYPDGGVSDIQRKQMATQQGDNVCVWAVRGNFDDCQTIAKAVFNDDAFAKELLESEHVALSSANSINWGRLLPQVVYYVSAYAEMAVGGKVERGAPIDVCVPTGNFGNILAAWYAKQMGTPIEKLLCASNENRVLCDFINSGEYDISEREFVLTPSPSMDILVSSNLERQLFELTGRNAQAIRAWMSDLSEKGCFRVDADTFAKLRADFASESVDSAQCLETIRTCFESTGYLMDPHTAVAYEVARRLRSERPVLVASTAHWAKFADNVYRALHGMAPGSALPENVEALTGCELIALVAKESGTANVPQGLAELDGLPDHFTQAIEATKSDVEEALRFFIRSEKQRIIAHCE